MNKRPIFMKINRSEDFASFDPHKISKRISNRQFLYIDFAEQDSKLSIMQIQDPKNGDSQQETEIIGQNHIAGLNQLSSNTYNLIKYLSDNRTQCEKIEKVDRFVRDRVNSIKNKKLKGVENPGKIRSNSNIKNKRYNKEFGERGSLSKSMQEIESKKIGKENPKYIKPRQQLFPQSEKVEQYLEKMVMVRVQQRLRAQQKKLQKSISLTGQLKKIPSKSLDLKINDKPIRLPSINSHKNR